MNVGSKLKAIHDQNVWWPLVIRIKFKIFRLVFKVLPCPRINPTEAVSTFPHGSSKLRPPTKARSSLTYLFEPNILTFHICDFCSSLFFCLLLSFIFSAIKILSFRIQPNFQLLEIIPEWSLHPILLAF